MTEPRRLNQGGGISQRLLDSASLDVPTDASRRRVALLVATASSFSSTAPPRVEAAKLPRVSVVRTITTWALIGAAASVTLAFGASRFMDAQVSANHGAGTPVLAELPTVRSPDISAEPTASAVEPWEPTLVEPWVKPQGEPNLDAARDAIARRDSAAALRFLDAYAAAHAPSALSAEAQALRIQALHQGRRQAEAAELAAEFERRFPGIELLRRVKSR